MVLYPEEGISDIQKLQMTSATGQNVSVIGGEPWIRCFVEHKIHCDLFRQFQTK